MRHRAVGAMGGGRRWDFVCVLLFVQVISDLLAEHDPYSYLFKD